MMHLRKFYNFHMINKLQTLRTYAGNTVDSRYLEFQGIHWNTSRYPYFDISELREWGKQ